MIVLESTPDDTENAILEGIFALIIPVITLTEGRWVAITRCIPAALANCASRHIASSTSPGACDQKLRKQVLAKAIQSDVVVGKYKDTFI